MFQIEPGLNWAHIEGVSYPAPRVKIYRKPGAITPAIAMRRLRAEQRGKSLRGLPKRVRRKYQRLKGMTPEQLRSRHARLALAAYHRRKAA